MANWAKNQTELVGLTVVRRARHGIHFQAAHGIRADFCGVPCHYLDTANEWQPIDTALKAIGAEFGAPGIPIRIGKDGQVRGVGHSQKSGRVGILNTRTGTFSHIVTLPDGAVDGDAIVREKGIYHERLILTENGLRQELVIDALPLGIGAGDPDEYLCIETAVDFDLPDGWITEIPAIGGYQFPSPCASDSTTPRQQGWTLPRFARKIGNVQHVYTGIPVSDLAHLAFPIVIDPDFTADTGDGYVGSTSTSYASARGTGYTDGFTSTATTSDIMNGYNSGSGNYHVRRAMSRFDTSSIGSGATVTQTTQTVTPTDIGGSAFTLLIAKQDWSAQDPLATGNMQAAFDNCLSAALDDGDFGSTSAMTTGVAKTSGNLNTAWVNKTGWTRCGYLASTDRNNNTPSTIDYVTIASRDHATPSYRPVLTVVYSGAARAPIFFFG